MVEKFKKILNDMVTQKGEVTLFALIKIDELTDRWSIVLSAPWATEENRSEVFRFLAQQLTQKLTVEESASIARIGIFQKNDHIVQLLLKFNQDTSLKNEKLNGFSVHEAYILSSNPSR